VLVTDGPYTETKEHMGGFWILECADLDEALAWAKKAASSAMWRRGARASFLPGSGENNGIVSPAATSEICAALTNGINEPARSYAAGSHPEGKGEKP